MSPIRLLAATFSILALAGCGRTESPKPAEVTAPPAATVSEPKPAETVSAPKPATAATPKAEVFKSPPIFEKVEVPAEPAPVAIPEPPPTVQGTTGTRAPLAIAPERLTDQEVKTLLENIEKKRSAFEGALDSKLKNSTIRTETGQSNTNEFFDDLQDQVERTRERFSSSYSASSEVLSLLQFASRLDDWASMQPAGFKGSKEWGALATDFRRLSKAYNSALLRPGQALGAEARRLNDAELAAATASIDKNMDAFRNAYDSALVANTSLTPATRQAAIKNVDAMKTSARALNTAVGKKQKGVAEAHGLLEGTVVMIDATLKLPPDASAAAAWAPVRDELSKVALAYEAIPVRPETETRGTSGSTAGPAIAERLTDQEVKTLLENIEKKRSAFEGALDDKLKNSTIKAERGNIKTNEFFDDVQDQVERTRERFASNYSASSEVLSLLQFAARLDAWASTQPAGFKGSKEWAALATDFRRLSKAYNSSLLRPGQRGLGARASRLNDAELAAAAAKIDKSMDAFRTAYDSALAGNTTLTPESRQSAISNVDGMKNMAKSLNAALGKKEKGVSQADLLLKGSGIMIDATLKLPPNSTAAAAWAPVRDELTKVAVGYEVAPVR